MSCVRAHWTLVSPFPCRNDPDSEQLEALLTEANRAARVAAAARAGTPIANKPEVRLNCRQAVLQADTHPPSACCLAAVRHSQGQIGVANPVAIAMHGKLLTVSWLSSSAANEFLCYSCSASCL
eukprot:1154043-Pelagomonas_calceolata.AAC.1